MRIEKTVLEVLEEFWKVKATSAFQILQLYSLIQENLPFERRNSLSFERLETQGIPVQDHFSKSQPFGLALSIIALEIQALSV